MMEMESKPLTKYKHYLITRFNIEISFSEGGEKIGKVDTCTDIDYLNSRFDLFERFTWSTVKNQTFQNFIWIVLFSDRTPENYKERIAKYKEAWNNFHPVYLSKEKAGGEFDKTINDLLLEDNCEYYVTTRIDNDDAIRKDFMEQLNKKIVQNFDGNDKILFYDYGVQYDINTGIASRYYYPNNHFTTLLFKNRSKDDIMKTILSYDHGKVMENYKTVNCGLGGGNPMWIEIIHGSNYGNLLHQNPCNVYYGYQCFNKFMIPEDKCPAPVYIFLYSVLLPFKRYILIIRRHGLKESICRLNTKILKKRRR